MLRFVGCLVELNLNNVNKNAEIDIFKVLDKKGQSNSKVVCQALDDLIASDIDIINMSFSLIGMGEHMQEVKSRCVKLQHENKLLICSELNNVNTKSYPADWQEVIGIKGINLMKENKILLHDKTENFFLQVVFLFFQKIKRMEFVLLWEIARQPLWLLVLYL